MQSGAAFVGGGVSIGGASAKVEWRDAPPSTTLDDATYVLDLAPRVQAPDADDMLTAVAASTAQASCSFLHEVVALGLAENYARAHPGAPLPDRSSLCVPLDSSSLAALLVELFPEAVVDDRLLRESFHLGHLRCKGPTVRQATHPPEHRKLRGAHARVEARHQAREPTEKQIQKRI